MVESTQGGFMAPRPLKLICKGTELKTIFDSKRGILVVCKLNLILKEVWTLWDIYHGGWASGVASHS